MPVDFLTEAERERWQRLPDSMPQDDLLVFFLLSDEDRQETQRQRDPQNRLGYALQLCILRYLGFVPDDLQAPPHEVVTFVAEQLEMDPSVLTFTTQACTSGTSPVLNPNRAKWLAQIGWKSTNQHLQHHRAVLAGAPRGRKLGGGKRAWDPVEPRLVPSQTVVTAVLAHR